MYRRYGRCFAEFLNEGSLVHLRLLASPTCVGFRYGYYTDNVFNLFLGTTFSQIGIALRRHLLPSPAFAENSNAHNQNTPAIA